MSKDIKGVDADKRTALHAILKEWISANIDMAKRWEDADVPWWYNERASLSVLAGAIWRIGGVVLEEYSDTKWTGGSRGARRKTRSGRCDCYFKVGSAEHIAEAKWGYSGATSEGYDPVPHIEDILDAAVKDSKELQKNGQCRLAIAFITPYIKAGTRKVEDQSLMIETWVDKIQEVNAHAKAWVFPRASRFMQYNRGDYCPGAAVFIREVPRA